MIINTLIDTNVTNRNISKLTKFGYPVVIGEMVKISYVHANPKRKIKCKCDECGIVYDISIGRISDINSRLCKIHRKNEISKVFIDFWNSDKGLEIRKSKGSKISKSKKGKPSTNIGERNGRWNPNKPEHRKYERAVKLFTKQNFNDELETLSNYNRRGIMGIDGAYNIDHKISINYGFVNNIPVSVIGHIANLVMIPWEENIKKSKKCSISLDELHILIKNYRGNYRVY